MYFHLMGALPRRKNRARETATAIQFTSHVLLAYFIFSSVILQMNKSGERVDLNWLNIALHFKYEWSSIFYLPFFLLLSDFIRILIRKVLSHAPAVQSDFKNDVEIKTQTKIQIILQNSNQSPQNEREKWLAILNKHNRKWVVIFGTRQHRRKREQMENCIQKCWCASVPKIIR